MYVGGILEVFCGIFEVVLKGLSQQKKDHEETGGRAAKRSMPATELLRRKSLAERIEEFREERQIVEKLIALRKKKGLSQAEFAELCGISQAALSKIEIGLTLPTFRTVCAIASGLGIPLTSLLSSEPEDLVDGEEFEQLLDSAIDALRLASQRLEEVKQRLRARKHPKQTSKSKNSKSS